MKSTIIILICILLILNINKLYHFLNQDKLEYIESGNIEKSLGKNNDN